MNCLHKNNHSKLFTIHKIMDRQTNDNILISYICIIIHRR